MQRKRSHVFQGMLLSVLLVAALVVPAAATNEQQAPEESDELGVCEHWAYDYERSQTTEWVKERPDGKGWEQVDKQKVVTQEYIPPTFEFKYKKQVVDDPGQDETYTTYYSYKKQKWVWSKHPGHPHYGNPDKVGNPGHGSWIYFASPTYRDKQSVNAPFKIGHTWYRYKNEEITQVGNDDARDPTYKWVYEWFDENPGEPWVATGKKKVTDHGQKTQWHWEYKFERSQSVEGVTEKPAGKGWKQVGERYPVADEVCGETDVITRTKYGEWEDGTWECDDTTVTQTRTVTEVTKTFNYELVDGEWVREQGSSDRVEEALESETRERELTDEEFEACPAPEPEPEPAFTADAAEVCTEDLDVMFAVQVSDVTDLDEVTMVVTDASDGTELLTDTFEGDGTRSFDWPLRDETLVVDLTITLSGEGVDDQVIDLNVDEVAEACTDVEGVVEEQPEDDPDDTTEKVSVEKKVETEVLAESQSKEELARTGMSAIALLVTGLLALIAGSGTLMARRRENR